MSGTYGKLILFRTVTVAVNLFLVGQLNIPFDFIAMLIGIPVTRPVMRGIIFALEILNLMLACLGLFFGNALMSKCAEVWVFGSHISPGMEAEIKRAKWKSYRLRYFTENCEEVHDVCNH